MSSYGKLVDIASNVVGVSAAFNNIVSTEDWAKAKVEDHIRALNDAVTTLNQVIATYDFTPDVLPMDPVNPEAVLPPTRPHFESVDFNNNWPDTNIPEPVLVPIGGLDWTYTDPAEPTEPSDAFDFTAADYSSDMYVALFAKVYNGIINGGTGLTDEVHAAILTRGREAFRVVDDREYRRALSAAGANGFDFPGDVQAVIQQESLQEIIAKETDLINNTTIKDFDAALDMTKFFMDKGSAIEGMLRDFFGKEEDRRLQVAMAAQEFILKIFEQSVKVYLGKWEGIKIKLEGNKEQVEAAAAQWDAEIKVLLGRYQGLQSKIDAIRAENQGKIDLRNSDAAIYDTDIKAYTAEQSSILERIKVILESNKLESMISLDEEKLKGSIFSDRAGLAAEISKAISSLYAQAAASAYGIINMSMGYRSGTQVNEGWTHGDRLTEQHSFSDE